MQRSIVPGVLSCLFPFLLLPGAKAQATYTASQRLHPSVFVMAGDTYTGLGGSPYTFGVTSPGLGGRNLTLTAGADVDFLSLHRIRLAVEARGSYPLSQGKVDGQKAVEGGLRASYLLHGNFLSHVHPYGDVLAGRGAITYVNGGYLTPGYLYANSTSAVYSGGGGVELDLTPRLAIKLDALVQRWNTPVTSSGIIYAKSGSGGLIYRFFVGNGP